MAKLWITRGLPASGKTRWARELLDKTEPRGSLIRLNRDDLRRMGLPTDYRVPQHAAEKTISVLRDSALAALLTSGRDAICDDTNLRARYVRDLMVIARDAGADVEIVNFTDVPVEECIRRDALRTGPEHVGEDEIRGMHTRFLAQHHGRALPVPELSQASTVELYVPPAVDAPAVFLVDVDGTLALMGDRSPYDESLVSEDLPNVPVVEAARALVLSGLEPVFMSGRTEACRVDTERWLLRNVFYSPVTAHREVETREFASELHMRAVGDTRPDHVVKLELFNQCIRHRYNVRLAIDDREQVVRLWRSLGIACLQVAEGKF